MISRVYSLGGTLLLTFVAAMGCATRVVHPHILDDVAALRVSPQGVLARDLMPTSYEAADTYRQQAEQAARDGQGTEAQLLGERAIAAFGQAILQARTLRATRAGRNAEPALQHAEQELASLLETEKQGEAEIRTLELRTRVTREALPVAHAGPTDPIREAARWASARAVATEARLLCVATRLLGATPAVLEGPEGSVRALALALDEPTKPAPLDLAMRTRAACLATLSGVRRPRQARITRDAADVLLMELGREEAFRPLRDERGVVVTLPNAFTGTALQPKAAALLSGLRERAIASGMPLLVVIHASEPPRGAAAIAREAERVTTVRQRFESSDHVDVVSVGATKPLLDPANHRVRNERIEVVFVDPG